MGSYILYNIVMILKHNSHYSHCASPSKAEIESLSWVPSKNK